MAKLEGLVAKLRRLDGLVGLGWMATLERDGWLSWRGKGGYVREEWVVKLERWIAKLVKDGWLREGRVAKLEGDR